MDKVESYLQYLEYEKRYSAHTIAAYRRDLLQLNEFLQKCGCADLDPTFKLIRKWIVELVREGDAPRTINRKIASLRSFFKFLQKRGVIEINPMEKVGLLKTEKSLPVFVTSDQMNELLDEETDFSDYSAFRDKMVLELFYMTGIRLSELIRIKEKDIDTSAMTLKVLGKRNKERIIPLTVPFCKSLKNYLSLKKDNFPDSDFLFVLDSGKPLYERWVHRLTSSKLGEITSMKKRSPHVIRHSFASNMLNNGADLNAIKELLGHANLAATQVYTHNSLKRIKKVYEQAHPRA